MGDLAYWGAQQVANTMFGKTATPPSTWYLALVVGNEPSGFITGAELDEPNDSAYARKAIPNNASHWREVTFGLVEQYGYDIYFPTATRNWGRVHSWAICDSATGGNIFSFGRLNNSKNIEKGDRFWCIRGAVKINFLVGV